MQALSEINIGGCPKLTHLPPRGFVDFISLKIVSISECPELVATSYTQENLLPSSLEKLTIGAFGLALSLLGSIQNLTSLTTLDLRHCLNVSSLPSFEILVTLTSLYDLSISCPELSSLIGIEALTSLRSLAITGCDKLVTMSWSQPPLSSNADNCSLQLDKLHISHASLILLKPLRSIKLTKQLVINDASTLISLPEEWLLQNQNSLQSLTIFNATNLVSLPSCMERLQFLEHLNIFDAQLVQSLPDLPLSLNSWFSSGATRCLRSGTRRILGLNVKTNLIDQYYQATEEALDGSGWFSTGDVGWIVAEHGFGRSRACGGMIVLEGRAKDTIVLSTGENGEPLEIEEAAIRSDLISQIVLVGQDRRRLGAIIVPNKDEMLAILGDKMELTIEKMMSLLYGEVRTWTAGCTFQIGPILIVDEPFTVENGLMTPTMKVRRDKVTDKYHDQIANMYK